MDGNWLGYGYLIRPSTFYQPMPRIDPVRRPARIDSCLDTATAQCLNMTENSYDGVGNISESASMVDMCLAGAFHESLGRQNLFQGEISNLTAYQAGRSYVRHCMANLLGA